MAQKTAYIWGPISSFTGPLVSFLVKKGWHAHVACKSSLNLLSLSPLDLRSSVQAGIEAALGGHDKAKAFQDRIKIVEHNEFAKGTTYDAVVFSGIPPNFDEPRGPRAPWSAHELKDVLNGTKGAPLFVVSSLHGGVQADGVVPEEYEFSRRKPQTTWESICQQYETKVIEKLKNLEHPWFLVRLPLLAGATVDGATLNYSGIYSLLRELSEKARSIKELQREIKEIKLNFNPNSTLWFMPVDTAVYTFWRFIEDDQRSRTLNLIPTNSLLNMEWIKSVGKGLGVNIRDDDEDRLNVNPVLRKLLTDNVQVKNRNLFEVAGRYHIPPVQIDEAYFQQIMAKAEGKSWGETPAPEPKKPTGVSYSDRLARFYFEEILPDLLNSDSLLDKAIAQCRSIGFVIKEASDLRWHLTRDDGQTILSRYEVTDERPKVCFKLSGNALVSLIQSKMPLHRALLMRVVEVEGPIFETLKVTNMIERFWKENPVHADRLNNLQIENAAT
ncbi:MAG: SCP2 sterol-binding domain-containing protein [Candidatus Melainabacteria bacterium]|nr:SCP2 sterol-binding domain-containing protein [Candidatus Melainabacteria bacterium]